MKAIIWELHKDSSYYHLNGLTFEVSEVLSSIICLNINGVKTDFSHSEVLIVDIANEMQRAYDSYNWNSSNKIFIHLQSYIRKNGICCPEPVYNCPA